MYVYSSYFDCLAELILDFVVLAGPKLVFYVEKEYLDAIEIKSLSFKTLDITSEVISSWIGFVLNIFETCDN